MRLKSVAPTEDDELICVIDWARWNTAQHIELQNLVHVPNEAKRNVKTVMRAGAPVRYCLSGQRALRKGLSPGYPDLLLDVARHGYHGLRIELKRKGGRLSAAQTAWIERLREQGYRAVVCVGAKAAIMELVWYLAGTGKKNNLK